MSLVKAWRFRAERRGLGAEGRQRGAEVVTYDAAGLSIAAAANAWVADADITAATLRSGADGLVLADSNEEGANLLALNTRQQLAQTALALASQADQAVLRLFCR